MQARISEMENEEVDYLRFDRIKIQRKRMQHILEVIKDLSFKNKQLFKENAALKEQRLQQSHYQKLYHQLTNQRTILIEKNLQLNAQLSKYCQTVLHQQILINSLKRELYGENASLYHTSFYEGKQNQGMEVNLISQEYKILQAQYDDLKKQYSRLYKALSHQPHSNKYGYRGRQQINHRESHQNHLCCKVEKQNQSCSGFIHPYKNKNSQLKLNPSNLTQISLQQDSNLEKLKEKYDKCKKSKKQLSSEVKVLKQALQCLELREERHIQLIELLKQKRTKICECHINKLKKKMSQTTIQYNRNPSSPHNN